MTSTILTTLLVSMLISCSEGERGGISKKDTSKKVKQNKKDDKEEGIAVDDSLYREHFFPLEEGESIEDYRDIKPNEKVGENLEYRLYSLTKGMWVEYWVKKYPSTVRHWQKLYKQTDSTSESVIKVRVNNHPTNP